MTANRIVLVIASSMAIGIGFGLVVGNKPFVLEATATPFGTFVLRYNPVLAVPVLPPALREPSTPWADHVA